MIKKYSFLIHLFFLLLFFLPIKTFAQCAGDDISLEVCDIPNPSSQAIDLFPLLGLNAVPGGTWSDDDLSRGLDETTGILNAQIIPSSGVYTYTYTVPDGSCADTSATITVTIGGYAGKAEKGTACSDDNAFNLFGIFDSSALGPQSNGSWTRDDNGVPISVSNFMDAEALGLGTFYYTYTVAAIGSCLESVTNGKVTVVKAAKEGIPSKLLLCDNTDMSVYSNLDLYNLLSGQDAGGTWVDNNGTGQITFPKDHNVDVKYIFDNKGIGEYSFSYTVLPENPKCDKKTATVTIIIEHLLDFTGSTLVVNSDICEPEIPTAKYSATLTKGATVIPDGQYYVTYSVSGPAGEIKTELLTFTNGVVNFPLDSKYFQQVGDFTVQITNIAAFGTKGACNNIINNLFDILHVYPIPRLDGAKLTIDPVCQNKSALVQITDAALLADGTYDIVYNLSGVNTAAAQTVQIVSVGGVSSFTIPSNFIVNDGNTVVTITKITNIVTTCTNIANAKGTVLINPLPSPATYKIIVDDYCLNEPVPVALSGLGTLANSTITYTLSGANVTTQTVSLVVSGGNANFIIPSNLLTNTGSNTINITNLINDDTTCGIIVSTVSDNFSINPIPTAPIATNHQEFCIVDIATVANLKPSGSQYQWFDSATATIPLTTSTALVSGDYYLREITPTSLCLSESTMVTVTIKPIANVPTATSHREFCKSDLATVANLIPIGSQYQWFDSVTATVPLGNSTTLVQGDYYLREINPMGLCFSKLTKVSVVINPIPTAPTTTTQQEFCKADAATVASLIPNGSQYQWFNSTTATTPLASSSLLVSGNYYLRSITPTTLCLSESSMVSVTINDFPASILNQEEQSFCGINEPKIADLSVNKNSPSSLTWYDAPTNGNLLNSTTLLKDKVIYYGFDTSVITDCIAKNNFAITVSLTDCSTTQYDFFIPDGFSPNGDEVNDTFRIPEIEFLFPDYTLEIYNRYGNMMFRGNKDKPNWDGRNSESAGFSDAIAPNGVYFYIVNFNKDNKSPVQGRLYLNR